MKKNKFILIVIIISLITIIFGVVFGNMLFNEEQELLLEEEVVTENRVSFVGVGDNLLHSTVYKDAKTSSGSYDFTNMYSEVKPLISQSDIAFINQETPIAGTDMGLSNYPLFNGPTEVAQNLEDVGFDLASLATNHSLDKGVEGLERTYEAFAKTDILTAGSATSQEMSNEIVTFEKNGITFSFLAYTYGTNGMSANNDYSVSYLEKEKITKDIEKAKLISDSVIVSAHWGNENVFEPTEFQEEFAQLFADLEVDVVIGHHPHTIQPVEWKTGIKGNQTLIVYSLGNFVGNMLSVDNSIAGMISFDFLKKSDTNDVTIENVEWIPLVIHFEGSESVGNSKNFMVYPLEKYTQELSEKHFLDGYNQQRVTVDYIYKRTKETINEEFYTQKNKE